MQDRTILMIAAIGCITALEIVNMLTMKLDGGVLSGAVGAIVFLITRKYYQPKKEAEAGKGND